MAWLMLGFASAAACGSTVYWQGTSQGFRIAWTDQDLEFSSPRGGEFSFRNAIGPAAEKFFDEMQDSGTACTYGRSLTLLSVNGPFLSLRDEMSGECRPSAHPTGEVRYTTIDMRKTGDLGYGLDPDEPMSAGEPGTKLVSLTDLFQPKSVLEAFLNDPVIQPNLDVIPESLADLPEALGGEEGFPVKGNPCKFELPQDYLTRFALHHRDGRRIAVRVLLRPVGGACRAAHAELGLLLGPAPEGEFQSLWAAGSSARKSNIEFHKEWR
jgi:hypothetical protein